MKSVLITGASRGLGYALVGEFIKQDYLVYAVVKEAIEMERLEKDFGDQCIQILGDVSLTNIREKIFEALEIHSKYLDVLINNAGLPGIACTIENVGDEELEEVMQVNCFGPLRIVQGALPYLKKSSNPIVLNISSRLASLTRTARGDYWHREFSYAYRISKAALNMLTICLNEELKASNIGVVSIHPGKLNTRISTTGADMTPAESAHNIFLLVRALKPEDYGKFIFPNVGEIEW